MSKQEETVSRPIVKLSKEVLDRVLPLFFEEIDDLPEMASLVCDGRITAILLPKQRIDELTTIFFMIAILQFKEIIGVEMVTICETTLPLDSGLELISTEKYHDGGIVSPEDQDKFLAAIAELQAYYELAVAEGWVFQEGVDSEEVPDKIEDDSTEADDSKDNRFD